MNFQNKWPHGVVQFEMTQLPREEVRQGCSLRSVAFDPEIGEEWFLFFGEEAAYTKTYQAPLDLNVITGAANTPFGPIGYFIWQIARGTPQEIMVEHWLNIHEAETLRMLLEAGGQTHLKLMIYDIEACELVNMIEFENTFDLDKAAQSFAHLARGFEASDFQAKQRFAMENLSLDQLLGNG
jgi:hypothetical protein